MSCCLCQQRHSCREEEREHNKNPNGVKNSGSRPKTGQLVHCDDREHKQYEDDTGDEQANETLNPRRRVVVNVLVTRFAAELRGAEDPLWGTDIRDHRVLHEGCSGAYPY